MVVLYVVCWTGSLWCQWCRVCFTAAAAAAEASGRHLGLVLCEHICLADTIQSSDQGLLLSGFQRHCIVGSNFWDLLLLGAFSGSCLSSTHTCHTCALCCNVSVTLCVEHMFCCVLLCSWVRGLALGYIVFWGLPFFTCHNRLAHLHTHLGPKALPHH